MPSHRCGLCKREMKSTRGLSQHRKRSRDCQAAFQRRHKRVIQQLTQSIRRHGEEDSDPGDHDGDLMNLVYDSDPMVLEDHLDVELNDDLVTQLRLQPVSPEPVDTPAPSTQQSRHVTVTEEPEDESAFVDVYVGAGKFERKRRDAAWTADFAHFKTEFGPFPSRVDWEFSHWATMESVSQNSVSRLLQIEALHQQLSFRSVRDVNVAVEQLPPTAQFHHDLVFAKGSAEPFDLYFRNPLDVIGDLLADPTFADHMSFAPQHRYTDESRTCRQYSEMSSGNWWWKTQAKLPQGATVLPIIVASDKTQLTSFTGKHECYPVYITIGNISKDVRRAPSMRAMRLIGYLPAGKLDKSLSELAKRRLRAELFHKCMRRIFEPLFEPAHNGVCLADSQGCVRSCHPILAAYIADYPEQCLVSCVSYGQACPVCMSLKDDFGRDIHGDLRDPQCTLASLRRASTRKTARASKAVLKGAGLAPIQDPFWADWTHANIHAAMSSDVLHQLVQGIGKHIVQWLIALAPEKELDARIQRLPLAHGLRHFKNGITELTNISGQEHKAIYAQLLGCIHGIVPDTAVQAATAILDFLYVAQYQCHSDDSLSDLSAALEEFHKLKKIFKTHNVRSDFDLPKLHALQHYVRSIRELGTTDNYNTEATERLHIDLAKHAFAATNHRDFGMQMCRWLERREKVQWFSVYLATRKGDKVNLHLGKPRRRKRPPVLVAKQPHRRGITLDQLAEDYGVAGSSFREAMRDFLRGWHKVPSWRGWVAALPDAIENALRRTSRLAAWNHVTFTTPDTQTLAAKDVVNRAFASPKLGRYDTVLVQTSGGEIAGAGGLRGIRVGRLRLIFTFMTIDEEALFSPEPPGTLALVEWFSTPGRQRDPVNGMFPVKRSRRDGHPVFGVVELVDVRRGCQLVPKFGATLIDKTLTPHTVLDAYEEFYLNNQLDKSMYMSLFWDDESDRDGS
ncbi:hypothetical protein BKA62DRAFT_617982 [Auriculariales sp. MPI-PUGE-AT-0066]|nr:hypothetical protein BKA62DRAFT_617982 [Auriculariales sp. MPI-PUGE-AT-0066]